MELFFDKHSEFAGAPVVGVPLSGALTNRVYKFQWQGRDYLYRLLADEVAGFHDRHRERTVTMALRAYGIMPKIQEWPVGASYQVWHFAEGGVVDRPSFMKEGWLPLLRQLHQVEVDGIGVFEPFAAIEAHLPNIKGEWQGRCQAVYDHLKASSQIPLLMEAEPRVLAHLDLWPGNILKSSDGIMYLLDFEYSQMAPRFCEFAHITAHMGWGRQELSRFIGVYFKCQSPGEEARVLAYLPVAKLYWLVWCLVALSGSDRQSWAEFYYRGLG